MAWQPVRVTDATTASAAASLALERPRWRGLADMGRRLSAREEHAELERQHASTLNDFGAISADGIECGNG